MSVLFAVSNQLVPMNARAVCCFMPVCASVSCMLSTMYHSAPCIHFNEEYVRNQKDGLTAVYQCVSFCIICASQCHCQLCAIVCAAFIATSSTALKQDVENPEDVLTPVNQCVSVLFAV